MEDGPPIFKQDFSCPVLLFECATNKPLIYGAITRYGWIFQSIRINLFAFHIQALSLSLAATREISVDFFSSRYLDVSVPKVRFSSPMYSD